jgi:parallel beta-helix repeat protein
VTQSTNYGILLGSSASNMITDNNVAGNGIGIELDGSTNNSIVGNNITANKEYGVLLTDSNYNMIYHNNFINNAMPKWQAVAGNVPTIVNNTWDNGYPSGGNYWSDYNGTDLKSGTKQNATGSDAIGDTPYDINFEQRDHYPLISLFHDFTITASQEYHIEIISNSTIANLTIATWLSSPTQYLQPGEQYLLFSLSGDTSTIGFCRVTIPRNLINGTYTVLLNWQPVPATELAESNSTHAYLYFAYQNPQQTVIIVPEYQTTILPIITMMAIAIIIAAKAKRSNRHLTCSQAS